MKKILILSIPHTGTVFTRTYVNKILKVPRSQGISRFPYEAQQVHFNIHAVQTRHNRSAKVKRALQYAEENCNVIIPLRNPIDNAISCLGRGHNDLIYCIENWRVLMEMYPLYKRVFWIDVWTPEANRCNMMLKLNEFLGIEPEQHLFDDYVSGWQKINNRTDVQMTEGERCMPFHDFDQLQFAVQWYNDMKIKLDKQYSMPLPMD